MRRATTLGAGAMVLSALPIAEGTALLEGGQVDHALLLARRRQEVVDGHVVEGGQPLQPEHGDDAVAALVGAEGRVLEFPVGVGVDVLERQLALLAHHAQALADGLGVGAGGVVEVFKGDAVKDARVRRQILQIGLGREARARDRIGADGASRRAFRSIDRWPR